MKVSDLMASMAAAGAPMEAILIAVRAIEERDEAIASKRAVERDRKRRQRAKEQDADGTVTGQSRDVDGTVTDAPPLSRPPNENNSNPPTHTHPDIKPRARKAHRLPVDWKPKPLSADIAALVVGWPDGAIAAEEAKFRDWAKAAPDKTGLKNDWDAAWRNWLRRKDEEGTYRNGRPHSTDTFRSVRGSRPNPALDMVLEAERELQAEAFRQNPGADWPPRLALPSG